MTNSYIHGSREYVMVEVEVEGEIVTTSVDFSLVQQTPGMPPIGPDVWVTGLVVDGATGFFLHGTEDVGYYRMYGRVTDDPEIPIFYCGAIQIVGA